ncbi:MAG: LCP family protein [Treponema sp.]|nr:LCP family protein [Treponema sp.]
MRKVKLDSSVILLGLIAILVIGGIILAVDSFRSDPIERAITGERVINTLFIIEKDAQPFSTYVLMFYPVTRRAAVFDIPGSTGGILQRISRVDRLTAVYDPQRIAPFKNEVERLLGIDIPFSFVMTVENMGKIIDLVQGVEVFIPAAVDEYFDGHILFPSGRVFLDGAKAAVFATYVLQYESEELVSARRQQFFMSFVRHIGEQSQFLKNKEASRLFHSFIRSPSNQRMRTRLFDEIAGVNIDRATIQTVRGTVRDVSGEQLLFPHQDGNLIREVVSHTMAELLRNDDSVIDRALTVEILNGTTVTGLASRTAELLQDFGYNIVNFGNADHNNYDRTQIIDRSGNQQRAKDFADIIRCRNIIFEPPSGAHIEGSGGAQNAMHRSDFTLILGRDFNGRHVTH